ncbi:MAG: AAA family ATPase [Muribaculaceae bacterium]|nr:AAA family ATPase [Muribaculaceae bacterium]
MPKEITFSYLLNEAFQFAAALATRKRHEFITPEHLLSGMIQQQQFGDIIEWSGTLSIRSLKSKLRNYLDAQESVPKDIKYEPELSTQLSEVLNRATTTLACSGAETVTVPHCLNAMLEIRDSFAASLVRQLANNDKGGFIAAANKAYSLNNLIPEDEDEYVDFADAFPSSSPDQSFDQPFDSDEQQEKPAQWRSLVTDIDSLLDTRNPLIGREAELARTIQVLCRKDKNNPLHVGEPGVGKTALVYGLARLIRDGKVPERLRDSHIYQIDLGSLLAGTQFRGDFEKRLKTVMDGIRTQPGAIVYIDEIHNLVGAGATGEGSMDAANMLKPYLERGDIRFIGSTTYEELNRHIAKSKGLLRRFQQIDITEPTQAEATEILRQLQGHYEEYHKVHYTDEAVEYAVTGSARHLTDRYLPDKAIDLLDEAGAWRELNPDPTQTEETPVVDKKAVQKVLAGMARIDTAALQTDEKDTMHTLPERVAARIFGQESAVRAATEAVLMSKAGLNDLDKPLASLLFVGPTGVGKTEVAVVLAKEMGVELVRFDMSEYAEKHAVAKLIGSPAGYVGYEDGGILTDAIRRSPSCVLLLDEVEKAHPDIYDILLQVMDYGRLSDNKGRHADFRNVVLIMTSNAGAQYAAQANVGFGSSVSAGQAMLKQVKRTFKPEFLNRLSATVVFNDMDRDMASRILDKKLGQLAERLAERKVSLQVDDTARQWLLREGVTREYGARELDRVIATRLKPLLMREILFGNLNNGGTAVVTVKENALILNNNQ